MATRKCSRCQETKPTSEFRALVYYCLPCERQYKKEHYQKNRASILAKARAWSIANKEKKKAADRAYAVANRDRIRELHREYNRKNIARTNAYKLEWRKANIEKTRLAEQRYRNRNRNECNARIRTWKKANPHVHAEEAMRRLAAELKATPRWADKERIMFFYREAQKLREETGEDFHVDHIVPLRSKLVCGLHCEANLRVIPAKENLKKNNRHWPDMP